MPTSAAGNNASSVCVRKTGGHTCCAACLGGGGRGGFTLIELLVVLAVLALASGGAVLALRDAGDAKLEREAVRLAALFESARAQSRASGIPIEWQALRDGFVFRGAAPGTLPSQWLNAGDTQVVPAATEARIVLGPEPMIAAQGLTLTSVARPGQRLRIHSDGLRPFAVAPETVVRDPARQP